MNGNLCDKCATSLHNQPAYLLNGDSLCERCYDAANGKQTAILSQEIDRLTAENTALRADNAKVVCAFCGLLMELGPNALRDMAEHVIVCEKHPLRAMSDDLLKLAAENAALKEDYERVCTTIAQMHAAAVGEITGPKRGVVEDVEDTVSALKAAAGDLVAYVMGDGGHHADKVGLEQACLDAVERFHAVINERNDLRYKVSPPSEG